MCGLFAGVGKLNGNRIIALGSMNEERGTDSVGLAYPLDGKINVAKIADRPCVGLNLALRKQVTEAALSGVFIGHTRQATQGEVNSRNAHPFLVDGIAFAHNGIIINDKDFGKYEVDSESLIHGIKARNFSKYEGPIALVWIEDGKLNAYRCGNPLYRGRHNGVTYLASDDDYLKAVGCSHVKALSEGMIYTFHNANSLTTERVKKNTVWAAKPGALSDADYQAWGKEYNTGTGWEDYQRMNYGNNLLSASTDKGEISLEEDFRTSKDIRREIDARLSQDYCDTCGELGELVEGMCLECIAWMDETGVNNTDSPPIVSGGC